MARSSCKKNKVEVIYHIQKWLVSLCGKAAASNTAQKDSNSLQATNNPLLAQLVEQPFLKRNVAGSYIR